MLGPPGAGKGTQAQRLTDRLQVVHIATGDIFRQAIKDETPLGRQAQQYVDSGQYVPDDIVVALVDARIQEPDARGGFILDGFPRTRPQAEALDQALAEAGIGLDGVVHLTVPTEVLVARSAQRRICRQCGRVYNLTFNPPPQRGQCTCGGEVIQRSDDSEETVRKRLQVYVDQTQPLVAYYETRGLLLTVDGDGPIDEVSDRIARAVAQGGADKAVRGPK